MPPLTMAQVGQTYSCSTGVLDNNQYIRSLRVNHEIDLAFWPLSEEEGYQARSTRSRGEYKRREVQKVLFKVISQARPVGLNSQSVFGCLIDESGNRYAYANIVLTRDRLTLHIQP